MTQPSDHPPPVDTSARVVHVDVGLLDGLLGSVGEMVVHRATLHDLGRRARSAHGFKELVIELMQVGEHLFRLSRDIQTRILKARLLPISHVFARFQPMIEALSKTGNRIAKLEILGETTEVDRKIADDLNEPLVHLIRNAFDHGIEPSDERIAASKPSTGTITLNAFHDGNHLVIEVSDDGRGLDLGAIREAAVARGICTREEVSLLDATGVIELVFAPGFSTRETVTSLSGRGVGMDAARKRVESIGGTLKLQSKPGAGTCARITMPLTLAIIQGLLVRVGDELYAIPLEYVAETLRAGPDQIETVDDTEVLVLRGEAITLIDTARVLGTRPTPRSTWPYVVVARAADRSVGLIVDHVVRSQEVVIKPLPKRLVSAECLSGAAVATDGDVFFILNVQGVYNAARQADAAQIEGTHDSA